jgi:hypothetical protein
MLHPNDRHLGLASTFNQVLNIRHYFITSKAVYNHIALYVNDY